MKVIITGDAGFIGCNAAARHLQRGDEVVVLDDLSRAGVERNLEWLRTQGRLAFARVDLRDAEATRRFFGAHHDASWVLHLAGQVAVTSSVADPRTDFEINAQGTLNVLEGMRASGTRAGVAVCVDEQGLRQPWVSSTSWSVTVDMRTPAAQTGWRRPSHSIFIRPTDARKGRLTSMCATITGSMACAPSCSDSRASTATTSSAAKIRGGSRGSSSPLSCGTR